MSEELAIAQAITQMWYNGEVDLYPSSSYGQANPDFSNFEGWGHYSQMVWIGSTKVGCAAQYCPAGTMEPSMGAWFSVCNYYPAGMSETFLLFIVACKLTRCRKRGWRVRRQRLGAWKRRHCHRGYLCISLPHRSRSALAAVNSVCFVWCMSSYAHDMLQSNAQSRSFHHHPDSRGAHSKVTGIRFAPLHHHLTTLGHDAGYEGKGRKTLRDFFFEFEFYLSLVTGSRRPSSPVLFYKQLKSCKYVPLLAWVPGNRDVSWNVRGLRRHASPVSS